MTWSLLIARVAGIDIRGHATFLIILLLEPVDRVSTAVDDILTSYQPDFAVVWGDRLMGVMTRDRVMATVTARSDDPNVTEVMEREVPRAEAAEDLVTAQERMTRDGARVLAVHDQDRYCGLVSREDPAEVSQAPLARRRRAVA